MKLFILLTGFLIGSMTYASEPPNDYPLVKAVIRKIDTNTGRISLKHEEIPNLNMPGMTMSFAVQNLEQLRVLAVGDNVLFVADEVEGETTVLWIEKAPAPNIDTASIFCSGEGNTSPKTKVDIEIRQKRFSTIRYEHIEGPYIGTAYENSIGYLKRHKRGTFYIYRTGLGGQKTQLIFQLKGNVIENACFSNFNANMHNAPVNCSFL